VEPLPLEALVVDYPPEMQARAPSAHVATHSTIVISAGRRVSVVRMVRRAGIAIGSLVIAYLATSLVAGALFGASVASSPLIAVLVIVLGGLIYVDILRRERGQTAP
jgi:hypothetical protein